MVVNILPTSQLMQVISKRMLTPMVSTSGHVRGRQLMKATSRARFTATTAKRSRCFFVFYSLANGICKSILVFDCFVFVFKFLQDTIQKEEEWNICANSNTSLNPAKNIRYVEQGCTRSKRQEQPLHLIQLATEVGKRKNLEQCKNGTSDLCGEGDP